MTSGANTGDRIVKPNLDSQVLQLEAAADSMVHQAVAALAAVLEVVQWEVLVQDARFMFPTFVPLSCDIFLS